MAINRFSRWLVAVVACTVFVARADAQHWQPFIEPDYFDTDLQFFAPADIDTLGGHPPANTGWFATYDRMYLWVTRPNNQVIPGETPEFHDSTAADRTWGNRVDLGYMTEQDSGWLFSLWHVDGPNANDVQIIERINRFNEDELDPDEIIEPSRDRNNLFTGSRDFFITNSINVASLTSYELNKTYRREQLHGGGWIEPLIGIRYMKFTDNYVRQSYNRFDEDFGFPLPPGFPPGATFPDFTAEQLNSSITWAKNDMIGAQLGFRYHQLVSRWDLSSELRVFALQNFQSFNTVNDVERIYYDDVGTGSEVIGVLFDRTWSADNSSEFVYGTEARAEAAYQLTKYLSVRVGAAFMHLPQGIGRGPDPRRNEQDLTLFGGTFGVALNR